MEMFLVIVFFIAILLIDTVPLFKRGDVPTIVFSSLVFLSSFVFVLIRSLHVRMAYIYPTVKNFFLYITESLSKH